MVCMLYTVTGLVVNFANIMNANDPGYNCSEHVIIITNHKIINTSNMTKNMVTVTKILHKKIENLVTLIYTLWKIFFLTPLYGRYGIHLLVSKLFF